MKVFITILLFFCSHSAFSQWCNKPNPDFCPGNFFRNGDFETLDGDPNGQLDQDINLADGWQAMWGSGSLADLFCSGGPTTQVAPTPNTNVYAGMWIDNRPNDFNNAKYREGMYNRLVNKIEQNSGTYSFSFKMANAIVGNTNPANPVRIGIYGVYNPSNIIAEAPTGLNVKPTNENLWLSKDPNVKVVKLESVDSPNGFSNTWVSRTVTFNSNLLSAPGIPYITHIMVTSDDLYRPTPLAKLYINFDEFCLQKTVESRFCCPGTNLVLNGDFESGNVNFTNQYLYNSFVRANATLPGQYNIVNAAEAATISPTWLAQDHGTCPTTPSLGKFLAVNGQTGVTTTGGWSTVWEQTIAVIPNQEYRFCANFKNLPQCGFDAKPVILVDVNYSLTYQPTTISTPSGLCSWQLVSFLFRPTTASATITIKVRDTQPGDGNDLAIDDIALFRLPQVPSANVDFAISCPPTSVTSTTFGLQGQAVLPPPNDICGWWWGVCEWVDNNGNNSYDDGECVANTTIEQDKAGWNVWLQGSTNFPGYQGTDALGSTGCRSDLSPPPS